MEKIIKAVINAAGRGERLQPVTLQTPKPMVKVNGVRMIDTEIRALLACGIEEIYVVVGYLGDRFTELKKDYPMITLIENPYAASCNNIASLYVARDHLEDAFILDGDLMIYNKDILKPEVEKSCYRCIRRTEKNNEWILTTDENGTVTDCTVGGDGMWQLYGISAWNREDGKMLKHLLEVEFEEKKNRQLFWDEIALYLHRDKIHLGIYEIQKEDILEIDNLSELIALDSSYAVYGK